MFQDESRLCCWCDNNAVLREPKDPKSGLFNQACKEHVSELFEDYKPTQLIATQDGKTTLDMSELVRWGVVVPRNSTLEARLLANRDFTMRSD